MWFSGKGHNEKKLFLLKCYPIFCLSLKPNHLEVLVQNLQHRFCPLKHSSCCKQRANIANTVRPFLNNFYSTAKCKNIKMIYTTYTTLKFISLFPHIKTTNFTVLPKILRYRTNTKYCIIAK